MSLKVITKLLQILIKLSNSKLYLVPKPGKSIKCILFFKLSGRPISSNNFILILIL